MRTAAAPAQPPVADREGRSCPTAGTPVGGDNSRDQRVGGGHLAHVDARTEFSGRALWSAMAECSARMALIQARTGDSTKQQQDGYALRAAYIMAGNRGDAGTSSLAAAANPVAQERARLARASLRCGTSTASAQAQIPNAYWGQVCGALETHAYNHANKIADQRQRVYAEKLKQYQQEQERQRVQYQQQAVGGGLWRRLFGQQLRLVQQQQPQRGGGSFAQRASSHDAAVRAQHPADQAGDPRYRPEVRARFS